jgi:antitoxin (DNA-binding transcriptional repressor) of toxin-antitoxin stability system
MREVLAAVERGETVVLTYRGEVWALMVPPGEMKQPHIEIADDPVFGMWRDREETRDAQAYVRKLRRPRFNMRTGERRRD